MASFFKASSTKLLNFSKLSSQWLEIIEWFSSSLSPPPSYPPLHSPQLQVHTVNFGLKILNGNSRHKHFLNFKLCAIKSHSAPFGPTWDVDHPFVQHIQPQHAPQPWVTQQLSWVSAQLLWYRNAWVQVNPYFYLTIVPKATHVLLLQYIVITVLFD